MDSRLRLSLLAACLVPFLARPAAGREPAADDLRLLREARLPTDGPALLEFFRRRTLTGAVRDRVAALVRRLGDDSFTVREKASADLIAAGPVAAPLLRAAARDPDPEIRRRAADCVRRLEAAARPDRTAAAVRVAAALRPGGAAAVLLGFLPSAEDEAVDEEVRLALASLALRDGKPEPALVAGLRDPEGVRRAAAAEALCRAGAPGRVLDVRRLLKDSEPAVRLRTAVALAYAHDRAAVPVLIALVGELPPEQAWPAEDALARLAGDRGPELPDGDGAAARKKRRDAWAAWWEKNGAAADLSRLDPARSALGYTLVISFEGTVRVSELGPDGKPRWEIPGLSNAVDAHVLPGRRVLIAEHGANQVTERDFKGKVLWQHKANGPVLCQRLANGHTFIVTMSQLVEVDRKGKEVFTWRGPEGIRAAHKFPDGRIGVVTGNSKYLRLDAGGKEQKGFPVQVRTTNAIGGVDFLPGGRLLISQADRVVEHDAAGKVVWQARVEHPDGVSRLPDGHTLVTSTTTQTVLELSRAGKVVRKFTIGRPAWLARRR